MRASNLHWKFPAGRVNDGFATMYFTFLYCRVSSAVFVFFYFFFFSVENIWNALIKLALLNAGRFFANKTKKYDAMNVIKWRTKFFIRNKEFQSLFNNSFKMLSHKARISHIRLLFMLFLLLCFLALYIFTFFIYFVL